jgi:uncharacterized repeat protein (TIGR01451 family)
MKSKKCLLFLRGYPMPTNVFMKSKTVFYKLFLILVLLLSCSANSYGAVSAGYSEYYIPGDELSMWRIFTALDPYADPDMHCVISLTAWSDNTTVYYDHWEDGYDFDPANPFDTADEKYTIPSAGGVLVFEDANIPTAPRGTAVYYDGEDRIYVAGGAVTVTRASWIQDKGVGNQASAWEIYPVTPQLTTYVLPFGEDLPFIDFQRVFVLIQGTENSTTVQFDFNGDGSYDTFCTDPNRVVCTPGSQINLNKGESFLLDNWVLSPQSAPYNEIHTGTVIQGSQTLQVKYIAGQPNQNSLARGFSAFPRGFWTKEYYAPADEPSVRLAPDTDYYLYNPNASPITINWESRTSSGSFPVGANTTASFRTETGGDVPVGSGLYFSGNDVFWGVGVGDAGDNLYEWGFSLLPSTMLYDEHFLGWAPGSNPVIAGRTDNGVFLTVAQDNTRVFVDVNNDETPDQTYTLDRLQTQYITDPDADLSQAHFWATGPFTLAYGQDADTAATPGPPGGIDLGYVAIPGTDFISLVLTVDKTVSPQVVSTALGSEAEFTIKVNSQKYTVDAINVTDTLPANWAYVAGSTTIALADQTQISGSSADPIRYAYRDFFNSASYSNNADNEPPALTWNGNWIEESDDNSAGGGEIRIVTDSGVTPNQSVLRFEDADSAIARRADLTNVVAPTLSFDYRAAGIDAANEYLLVQVCENSTAGTPITCAAGWTQVAQIGTNYATYQHYEVNLSTLLTNLNSANFAVRFTTTGVGSSLDGGDYIYIDNLEITSPPTWPSSLLGNMAENQEITITFTAETTAVLPLGTLSQNKVNAVGSRTFGTPSETQIFEATDFAYVASGDIQISKISSAPTPLYPGDTFTYTVTVTNPSLTSDLTGISIYDPLPEGVIFNSGTVSYPVTAGAYTYNDTFGTTSYTNSNGTASWHGSWQETNDDGNPSAGKMQINTNRLNFRGTSTTETFSIERPVPLGGTSGATLSFTYSENGTLEAADQVVVDFYDGTTWHNVTTISDDGSATFGPFPISTWSNANSRIRFTATGYSEAGPERWQLDDITINFSSTGTVSGPLNSPPNFISSSDGYSLTPGQQMTLTYNVTVDDPLATGIEEITNTAFVNSNEIILPLSASVTDIVVNPSLETAEVSGYVWLDVDRGGDRDIGEPGLANVEVTLKDQFGTPIATTSTDGTGHYVFPGIEPGNDYYVEVTPGTLPAGLGQTAPTGHTDDRSNSFDLTAGQSKSGDDVDLGYAPPLGTATFGDLVWSDFDGDGIRDLGEPGLAGITVQFCTDDGDLLWEPGTDVPCTSTVTSAGGNYLFTGVTADGVIDYFIVVDLNLPTNLTPLTDYTSTTVNPWLVENANAGDVLVPLDFGFQNATGTYTITDRIWYDTNADEQDDGETGIAGVTVALLDASLNVIATTITDANGYFTFNGIIGSDADYTVRVTDTGNILSDYYGVTDEAIAGEVDVNNVTGNVDFTVEGVSEPNFGYGLSRSISGTVFSDLGGTDGVRDADEPGMGGVTVSLYSDDGDNILDAGDTLIATVTTDSNGNYLFSGLGDGFYFISINTPPSGYTYTSPDLDPAAGDQQTAAISGGGNVENLNFGYRSAANRSVSGTVWDNTNSDAIIDAGETGLAGVTVELRNGSTVIASTTTDTNGDYSFSGLLAQTYTIVVTDTLGVLAGYEANYDITAPFDGIADGNLTAADMPDVNFGFRKPIVITLAVISDFKASTVDGVVVVSWDTVFEKGTIGFYLYRFDEAAAAYVPVNEKLIPGLVYSPRGGAYRVVDRDALPGKPYSYQLVEIEASRAKERKNTYGPFQVIAREVWGQQSEELPANGQFERAEHPVPEAAKARLAARNASLLKSAQIKGASYGTIAALAVSPLLAKRKVGVSEKGLYYLEFSQLPFVKGIGKWSTQYTISSQLLLKNKGQQIPYFIANGNTGVYFYGGGIESVYTDTNVYWAERGRGTLMQTLNGKGPQHAPVNQTFFDTAHIEEDTFPFNASFLEPTSDFWSWGDDLIYAGYPGLDSQAFTFSIYGLGTAPPDESATLTVQLLGFTDTNHHVILWLNDEYVGVGRWSGIKPESFTFPINQTLLKDAAIGENTIIVEAVLDADVPYSEIAVDSFDIGYYRTYTAIDDALLVTGGTNPVVTVEGFSNPSIFVLDVSNAVMPKRVNAITVEAAGPNSYRVNFVPATPETRYFVTSLAGLKAPVSSSIDAPSSLKTKSHNATYLLITSGGLKSAVENLARYRQQKGLTTEIVDVEDIMDEFNHGIFSPEAVRSFFTFAVKNWLRAPRYAVLVGEDSYDYKDFLGMSIDIIPSLPVSTPDGIVASDTALADVDGDHLPEIAIGRLPVLTTEELDAVVNKIKGYETEPDKSWRNSIVMIADHPKENADFPSDSDSVAALLPDAYLPVTKIYMSQKTLAQARGDLQNALLNGSGLINYIGHGGPDRLEQNGILLSSDIESMTNTKLPVFTAMTCAVGIFSEPGYDFLAESLVKKPNSGAIAVWSPAGYSNNEEAVIMDKEFFRSAYLPGASARRLLGDVVLEALENAKKNGVSDYMLEIYNVMGDPALMLR